MLPPELLWAHRPYVQLSWPLSGEHSGLMALLKPLILTLPTALMPSMQMMHMVEGGREGKFSVLGCALGLSQYKEWQVLMVVLVCILHKQPLYWSLWPTRCRINEWVRALAQMRFCTTASKLRSLHGMVVQPLTYKP